MSGLQINLSIDLGDLDALDEARLAALFDGIRSLRTRLQLADRPAPAPPVAPPVVDPPAYVREPDPTPVRAVLPDAPLCKVDGCDEPTADRRGIYGRLCADHKAKAKAASAATKRRPSSSLRNDGMTWCSYCRANRTALHVEQHQAQNDAERRRIEEGRASVAHLQPDPQVRVSGLGNRGKASA